MNFAILMLRVVVGGLFIGHGTQKLFGWFGGGGPEGTGQFLAGLRYPKPRAMAVLAGLAEAGGGTLLLLGFLTPVGAAAIIGVMINAMLTAHRGNGLWNTNGGSEFPLTLAVAAAAIAFTGAGRYSVDALIGWKMSGADAGVGAIAMAAGAATITLLSRKPATEAPSAAERRRAA